MTEKELREAIASGSYEDAQIGYRQDETSVVVNGERVSIGKYGDKATAFYCVKVELTDKQYKAVRLLALKNALEHKKDEYQALEHEKAELESAIE